MIRNLYSRVKTRLILPSFICCKFGCSCCAQICSGTQTSLASAINLAMLQILQGFSNPAAKKTNKQQTKQQPGFAAELRLLFCLQPLYESTRVLMSFYFFRKLWGILTRRPNRKRCSSLHWTTYKRRTRYVFFCCMLVFEQYHENVNNYSREVI